MPTSASPTRNRFHLPATRHLQRQLEAGEAAEEERWRGEVSRLRAAEAAIAGALGLGEWVDRQPCTP